MKKIYKLDVNCANCVRFIEDAAKKVSGVADCTVDFMTLKMTVVFEDGIDSRDVIPEVIKACKRVEPDFAVY